MVFKSAPGCIVNFWETENASLIATYIHTRNGIAKVLELTFTR